ncbi:hypothetical protein CYMTET_50226 [Cymbomonas tetramitiformis]|uniref:Centromere protein J C-terminal domain-containing protein n=1 Tax=Cymbomonas tetramitiformis TaxID=36881 RepID=A0AAE0BNM9_9CHLO|nr:hypothetical protein CYMTET_50226 [Cymbomonas tetramitiformis]
MDENGGVRYQGGNIRYSYNSTPLSEANNVETYQGDDSESFGKRIKKTNKIPRRGSAPEVLNAGSEVDKSASFQQYDSAATSDRIPSPPAPSAAVQELPKNPLDDLPIKPGRTFEQMLEDELSRAGPSTNARNSQAVSRTEVKKPSNRTFLKKGARNARTVIPNGKTQAPPETPGLVGSIQETRSGTATKSATASGGKSYVAAQQPDKSRRLASRETTANSPRADVGKRGAYAIEGSLQLQTRDAARMEHIQEPTSQWPSSATSGRGGSEHTNPVWDDEDEWDEQTDFGGTMSRRGQQFENGLSHGDSDAEEFNAEYELNNEAPGVSSYTSQFLQAQQRQETGYGNRYGWEAFGNHSEDERGDSEAELEGHTFGYDDEEVSELDADTAWLGLDAGSSAVQAHEAVVENLDFHSSGLPDPSKTLHPTAHRQPASQPFPSAGQAPATRQPDRRTYEAPQASADQRGRPQTRSTVWRERQNSEARELEEFEALERAVSTQLQGEPLHRASRVTEVPASSGAILIDGQAPNGAMDAHVENPVPLVSHRTNAPEPCSTSGHQAAHESGGNKGFPAHTLSTEPYTLEGLRKLIQPPSSVGESPDLQADDPLQHTSKSVQGPGCSGLNQSFDDGSDWGDEGSPARGTEAEYHKPGTDAGAPSFTEQWGRPGISTPANSTPWTAVAGRDAAGDDLQPSALVQSLFYSKKNTTTRTSQIPTQAQVPPQEESAEAAKSLADGSPESQKVDELESEILRFRQENERAAAVREQAEAGLQKLHADAKAFEQRKHSEMQEFEEYKAEEVRKLKRDKRVLEKQARQLLKLPNKQQRTEVEALQAALQRAQDDFRAKEARHKLTVDRLRRQNQELTERNEELREEVKRLEGRILDGWENRVLDASDREPVSSPNHAPPASNKTAAAPQDGNAGQDGARGRKASEAAPPIGAKPKLTRAQSLIPPAQAYSGSGPSQPGNGATFQRSKSIPLRPNEEPQHSAEGSRRAPGSQAGAHAAGHTGDPMGSAQGEERTGENSGSWSQRSSMRDGFLDLDLSEYKPVCFDPDSIKARSHRTQLEEGTTEAAGGETLRKATWRDEAIYPAHAEAQGAPSSTSAPASFGGGPSADAPQHNPSRQAAPPNSSASTAPSFTGTGQGYPTVDGRRNNISAETRMAAPVRENEARKPHCADDNFDRLANMHGGDIRSFLFAPRPSLSSLPIPDDGMAEPLQETKFPDGKMEKVYSDGRRSVLFANGTRKEQFGANAGGGAIVFFVNGDVKRTYTSGRVDYYYAEVDTWHTTHVTGIEVYHFAGGQCEAHHQNGDKDIAFPDGSMRHIAADGTSTETMANTSGL